MEKRRVTINNDVYELTAVPADISGPIAIDLISNFAPLIVAFFDNDFELLNKELRTSIDSEKIMRIFKELINVNMLYKNNELVKDWRDEFARKPYTLFQLGYEALRFNCEDFFTFISGFVKEKILGQNWSELMQNLEKEGVEIPQMFSFLTPNGKVETEKIEN